MSGNEPRRCSAQNVWRNSSSPQPKSQRRGSLSRRTDTTLAQTSGKFIRWVAVHLWKTVSLQRHPLWPSQSSTHAFETLIFGHRWQAFMHSDYLNERQRCPKIETRNGRRGRFHGLWSLSLESSVSAWVVGWGHPLGRASSHFSCKTAHFGCWDAGAWQERCGGFFGGHFMSWDSLPVFSRLLAPALPLIEHCGFSRRCPEISDALDGCPRCRTQSEAAPL